MRLLLTPREIDKRLVGQIFRKDLDANELNHRKQALFWFSQILSGKKLPFRQEYISARLHQFALANAGLGPVRLEPLRITNRLVVRGISANPKQNRFLHQYNITRVDGQLLFKQREKPDQAKKHTDKEGLAQSALNQMKKKELFSSQRLKRGLKLSLQIEGKQKGIREKLREWFSDYKPGNVLEDMQTAGQGQTSLNSRFLLGSGRAVLVDVGWVLGGGLPVRTMQFLQ